MPAEKVVDKAREARMESRKSSKPIMEKRRRARINESLTELKTLILEALNKDSSRHSKLEKADILEMTVKHLRNLQRQQMAAAVSTDPSLLGKYRSGFSECMTEVSRVMGSMDGVDGQVKQRLINHLATHQPATNVMSSGVYAGVHPSAFPHVQPVQVQVPASASVPMQRVQLSPTQGAYPQAIQTTMYGGIPVVPGHFVGGEPVAVLLPSGQTIVQTNGQQQVVPVQYTNTAVVSAAQPQGHSAISVSSANGLSQTVMPSHPVPTQAATVPTKVAVTPAPIPEEKMWRPW
uniref:Hairy D protein n=1 Tax=Branchiostoma floridae TaxID=7739 RepID=Q6V6Z3_BRAFL|nr:hairy D protein [Branchiostoma floridae]